MLSCIVRMRISDAEGNDPCLAVAPADSDETTKHECRRLLALLRSVDNNRSRTVGRDAACRGGISLARPCMLSGMKSWQRGDALGSCSVRFSGWVEANGAIASSRHSGIFSPAFGLTNTLWQVANENLPDGQYCRTSHCRARRRGSRIPLFTEIIKSRRAAGIYSVPRLQSLNRVGLSAMVPVRTCRRCIVL